jgi:uncharacterized protein YbjQ (UPF0145 family)
LLAEPKTFLLTPGNLGKDDAFTSKCHFLVGACLFQISDFMLTVTTDTLQNRNIAGYIGVVSGTAIIGGEDREVLIAALAAAADGIPMAYERLEREARLLAMDRMRDQAERAGGNAIVGLKIRHEALDVSRHVTMIFAMGTAVKAHMW